MARPSELSNYTSAIDELIPAKYRGRVHLIVNGSFLLNAAGIDTQFPAKFLLNAAGIDTQFPAKKSTELARLLAEMPPAPGPTWKAIALRGPAQLSAGGVLLGSQSLKCVGFNFCCTAANITATLAASMALIRSPW
jgi:hypothetical protein